MIELISAVAGEPDITLPPAPDGGEWPYAVVTNHGDVLVSDSASELVAAGLPGYRDLPDDESGYDVALIARYEDLLGHAAAYQQYLLEEAHMSGAVPIDALDDDTLTALMVERAVPYEGDEWTCAIPLVLIATDYQPFTDRALPTGNIIWVDPITDVTYLQSLHSIGVLRFMVNGSGATGVSAIQRLDALV